MPKLDVRFEQTNQRIPIKFEEIRSAPARSDIDLYGLITRTITEFSNSKIKEIGTSAFANASLLASVNFPNVTNIGKSAFESCVNLKTVSFPKATTIKQYAFSYCMMLRNIAFPKVTSIGTDAFQNCINLNSVVFPCVESVGSNAFRGSEYLKLADFPVVTSIASYAFYTCKKLASLLLRNTEEVCALTNKNALTSTLIASGTGYIYVPSALLESYKVATNWSAYAAQFRVLEEYTVDGTTTGELDKAKI